MKLISVNVEGSTHLERTLPFFTSQVADVVCVQECNKNTQKILEGLGYTTHFLPITLRKEGSTTIPEGLLLASLLPVTFKHLYYFEPAEELILFKKGHARETCKQGLILGTIIDGDAEYHIATNHFTWTPDGSTPNQNQKDDLIALLEIVKKFPPHVMCGDFNIPRHENYLYHDLLTTYTDGVPERFKSSMDKNLHRVGNDPEKVIMFEKYMVDYIFTQAPYKAENVRLEFGISDHAAVIGDISKK
jgi:hypothetical protein